MAVPFPNILDILRPALPPILVIVALVLAIKIVPSVFRRLRQRAYDQVIDGETRRLEVVTGRGRPWATEAAVALIRGLHPGRRMGEPAVAHACTRGGPTRDTSVPAIRAQRRRFRGTA
jgi:hypothetical protein